MVPTPDPHPLMSGQHRSINITPPVKPNPWLQPSVIITLVLTIGGWVFTAGVQGQQIRQLERDVDEMHRVAKDANAELGRVRVELAKLSGILQRKP